MKILYVHHQGKMGGAEHSLLNLFRGLDRNEHEILAACPASGRFADALTELGIRIFPFSFCRLRNIAGVLLNSFRLARIVRRQKVHLIHGNAPRTNIPAGLAGKLSRIPAVWHARNIIEPGMTDVDRMFSGLATHIVCNSQAIRNRFKGIRGYDGKTSVIINAVNADEFSPSLMSKEEARVRLKWPHDAFILGTFDRLDPVKDHETVIKAFARLYAEHPHAALMITGEAFLDHERRLALLESLAAGLGVQSAVRFLGFRNDVTTLMAACDIIALASRHEGCSRVLCEAQAMGRPVVATDNGGNPELVEDDKTGLLFPVGDDGAMAERICALLTNPKKNAETGKAAREKALRDFSIDRHCAQTVRVYESALGNR